MEIEPGSDSMCGICGILFIDPRARGDRDLVVAMRDLLAHRGPDGAGDIELPGATLGHRRLSIIDLEHGEQPMTNEDETIWVTFNGEIYNFPSLRAQLLDRGHRFRTRCDTEVLVHGYEEWGDQLVNRLNGMFAFALVDLRRRRTLLARDHLGIKPLFYARTATGLAFASEIKGVLPALADRPAARPESIQEYLMFRYIAWDATIYDRVHRLPPGHLAIWQDGRLSVRGYWSPDAPVSPVAPSLDAAADELESLLGAAVERQLISDVPLGAFCSGGVDSGLVTSCAARGSSDFRSFSVGFEDAAWDETELARDTATRAGAEHHVVVSSPGALETMIRRLIHFHDEPLSHPNSVPLYELSGLARRHVTVVLTGEGADELFAGYPRYHLARLRAAADALPRAGRIAAAALLDALPGHRAAKAARMLPLERDEAAVMNSVYVDAALVTALTHSPVGPALETRRDLVTRTRVSGDAIASLGRYELLTYLPCALDRMDRMSMAHGLEGRVPFLDRALVEWGLALPSALKLAGRSNKRVVKQAARRSLAARVVDGPKSGFGLPLDAWFRGSALAPMLDRMGDGRHPAAEYVDDALVSRLVREHRAATHDHGEALWLLTNLYLWAEREAEERQTPLDVMRSHHTFVR